MLCTVIFLTLRMAVRHPTARLPFRKRHPTLVRAVLASSLAFLVAFGVGLVYASWALVCRGGPVPVGRGRSTSTRRARRRSSTRPTAASSPSSASSAARCVKIDEIPQIVQDAFVVTEDKRFYEHAGIDWHRAAGAVLR